MLSVSFAIFALISLSEAAIWMAPCSSPLVGQAEPGQRPYGTAPQPIRLKAVEGKCALNAYQETPNSVSSNAIAQDMAPGDAAYYWPSLPATSLSDLWPLLKAIFSEHLSSDTASESSDMASLPHSLQALVMIVKKLGWLTAWPHEVGGFRAWMDEKLSIYLKSKTSWTYRIYLLRFLVHLNRILVSPVESLVQILSLDLGLYSTTFMYIAAAGQVEVLEAYLQELWPDSRKIGRVLLVQDSAGISMLHVACKNHRLGFIRYLIQTATTFSPPREQTGTSPLCWNMLTLPFGQQKDLAIYAICRLSGCVDSVELLFEELSKCPEMLRMLIEDPNILLNALKGQDWCIVKYLVQKIHQIGEIDLERFEQIWVDLVPNVWNLLVSQPHMHSLLLNWIQDDPALFPMFRYRLTSCQLECNDDEGEFSGPVIRKVALFNCVFLRWMVKTAGFHVISKSETLREVYTIIVNRHPEHVFKKFSDEPNVIEMAVATEDSRIIQFAVEPLWKVVDPLIVASALGADFFYARTHLSRPLVYDWIQQNCLPANAIPKYMYVLPYLHCVVLADDSEMLACILEHSNQDAVHEVDRAGNTCLHLAWRQKQMAAIEKIINRYPDLLDASNSQNCSVRALLEEASLQ